MARAKKIEINTTARGFALGEFVDRYRQLCSIQDSSLADEAAIWLGVDNHGPDIRGPGGQFNEAVAARMHLTIDQVRALLPILSRFVETGSVEEQVEQQPATASSKG